MAAAEKGHLDICNLLLEHGAPWNAVDRRGRCAGNYATDAEHWDIVNLLVEHATKAELILGASMRSMKGATNNMPPPPIPTKNDKEDAKYEQTTMIRRRDPSNGSRRQNQTTSREMSATMPMGRYYWTKTTTPS